jgi:hypothetical protein
LSLGSSSSSKEEEDKNNNKHNLIFAQRRKAANGLENRKTIVAQGLGHTMRSKADTKLLCDQLFSSKTFPILDNMTMSAAIESNSFAIYIGPTARALKEENLRFLTERGAQDQRASRSGLVV